MTSRPAPAVIRALRRAHRELHGHRRIGLVLDDDRQLERVAEVQEPRRARPHHQRQPRGQRALALAELLVARDRDRDDAVARQVVGHLDRDRGLAVGVGVDRRRERRERVEVRAHRDRRRRLARRGGRLRSWWRPAPPASPARPTVGGGIGAARSSAPRHPAKESRLSMSPPARPDPIAPRLHLVLREHARVGARELDVRLRVVIGRVGGARAVERLDRVGELIAGQCEHRLVDDDHRRLGVAHRHARPRRGSRPRWSWRRPARPSPRSARP